MKLPDIASKIKLPGRKKKKWILAGGVLVLIVGGLGIHSYRSGKGSKRKNGSNESGGDRAGDQDRI